MEIVEKGPTILICVEAVVEKQLSTVVHQRRGVSILDKGNDEVAEWFRTLHPAVLHSIDQSLKAGRQADIPVIVCGEMASTPAYVVLLVGLGATDLSMTPSAIPRVRRAIAGIDAENARRIAEDCLNCDTADEVEGLIRDRFAQLWPSLFDSTNLPVPRQSQNPDNSG